MLCNDAVKTRQKWWKLHLPTLLLLLFSHADCFPKYCFRNFLVDDGFLKILRFRAICELLCRYFFICILNLFCFCLFFIGFFLVRRLECFPLLIYLIIQGHSDHEVVLDFLFLSVFPLFVSLHLCKANGKISDEWLKLPVSMDTLFWFKTSLLIYSIIPLYCNDTCFRYFVKLSWYFSDTGKKFVIMNFKIIVLRFQWKTSILKIIPNRSNPIPKNVRNITVNYWS